MLRAWPGAASGLRLANLPPHCDVADAVAHNIQDLAGDPPGSLDEARGWLDRLRRTLHAADALFWNVTATTARVAMRSGTIGASGKPAALLLEGRDVALDRLRRQGVVLCGSGQVSGVEEFVPSGVESFVAAAATRARAIGGVLVVGWNTPLPLCGSTSLAQLRVAAALLDRSTRASRRRAAKDAGVRPATDRIVVLDRQGIITGENEAWTRSIPRGRRPREHASRVNYLALPHLQREGTDGRRAVADSIADVCSGASDFFQTAIAHGAGGQERWSILTATPITEGDGGAVVLHSDLTAATVDELTRRITERRFVRFVDAVPVPFWIAAADGRIRYASRRWEESLDDSAATSSRARQWLDPVHPHDRARAAAAFADAVARHDGFHIEVRLRTADGAYPACVCIAAPLLTSAGTIDAYIGLCVDISARQQAEWARDEIAAKLLTAQEAERTRIARDLHDDLGHQIVLLDAAMQTAMRHRWPRARLEATIIATRRKLQDIAHSIHTLAYSLHPAKLKLLGLAPTLDALCREMAAEGDHDVRFIASAVPADIDEDVAICLFRVAQEALQNVVKHSGARAITVNLIGHDDQLTLRIDDDGGGFDPLLTPTAGLGLLTMRERVELVGGTLAVKTAPTRGTSVEVVVSAHRPPLHG